MATFASASRRLGYGRPDIKPIPESAELIEEFGKVYDVDLLEELEAKAAAVRELVPDAVGVSLAGLDDGVAFTLVATDADVAILDAIQYAFGGRVSRHPGPSRSSTTTPTHRSTSGSGRASPRPAR